MNQQDEKRLKQFLNLVWLRPEQALFFVFKSKAFDDLIFESPSIDISCGDGLFMFLHLDGELDENFDRFQSTSAQKFKHGKGFVDIYDSFDEGYTVPITKKAKIKIDYGTDWKQNLLDKAARLDLYKKLIQHDNMKLPLPFKDNYFKTIYSNSIYWTPNIEELVADIRRILHPDGTAVLEVLTPYFLEPLERMEKFLSPEAITIFDRNRRKTMPGRRPFSEWEKIMSRQGFKIVKATNVFPNKLLINIWNIGLRPIAHLLTRMASALPEKDKLSIKKDWVDIMFELGKPLLKVPQTCDIDHAPYISFVLKK